jgi:hypothetical protein
MSSKTRFERLLVSTPINRLAAIVTSSACYLEPEPDELPTVERGLPKLTKEHRLRMIRWLSKHTGLSRDEVAAIIDKQQEYEGTP